MQIVTGSFGEPTGQHTTRHAVVRPVWGKRLVVLVGTPKAVAIAVKRADAVRRYSALRERLQIRIGGM